MTWHDMTRDRPLHHWTKRQKRHTRAEVKEKNTSIKASCLTDPVTTNASHSHNSDNECMMFPPPRSIWPVYPSFIGLNGRSQWNKNRVVPVLTKPRYDLFVFLVIINFASLQQSHCSVCSITPAGSMVPRRLMRQRQRVGESDLNDETMSARQAMAH